MRPSAPASKTRPSIHSLSTAVGHTGVRSTARAALQLFLQLLQRCRASTASTLCPGPTVEALQPLQRSTALYSLYSLYSSTASTLYSALHPPSGMAVTTEALDTAGVR